MAATLPPRQGLLINPNDFACQCVLVEIENRRASLNALASGQDGFQAGGEDRRIGRANEAAFHVADTLRHVSHICGHHGKVRSEGFLHHIG